MKGWDSFSKFIYHFQSKIKTPVIKLETYEGARGVMVIVVGNEHGDKSSNPG